MAGLSLVGTTDTFSLITDSAANIDVVASLVDSTSAGVSTVQQPQLTTIAAAATTTIVSTPGSGLIRALKFCSMRNRHASLSNTLTFQLNRSSTLYEIDKLVLLPGEAWHYVEGVGFFHKTAAAPPLMLFNQAVTSQALADVDVYLAGSFIVFPRPPKIGTRYRLVFDTSKTAAGTVAPQIVVRFGTAGTTSDTARITENSFASQTANTDVARFTVDILVRTAGAAGVVQSSMHLAHHNTTTGYSQGGGVLQRTSASFDLTVAGLGIGCSFIGGTSHSGTLQLLDAQLINP